MRQLMITSHFLSIFRRILILSIITLFVGCGGGGGGGGANPSSSFSISGTVTGAVSSGVTITFSGSSSGAMTTDANGNYTFSGLANGSYTITPSLSGYVFNPVSEAVTINGANIFSIDFTAAANTNPPTYTISGTVTVSGGGALPGVTVTLSGNGTSGTTFTDANGNYTFTGLTNGSYTITPSRTGYIFTHASTSVTLNGANSTTNNFTATPPPTPSISIQDSLDFGVALIGDSSFRQLLISNTGSGTLKIGQLSLRTGSAFHIIKDCSGTSIPLGGTCSLTLSLTPNSQSDFSDTLTIPSNESTKNPLTVTLTGKGRALNSSINSLSSEVTTNNRVVKFLLSISDIAGDPVVGLKETCFTVTENGIQKTISSFIHPITTPISVDLVFDFSGSLSASDQLAIQNAADSFVAKLVNGVDETAVMKFALSIGAKTDFTTDQSAVIAAIDTPYSGDTGGTILYDSLITAIDDTALRTNTRRAIIVFSDGNDEESANTLTAVINRAILKGIPIFAIAYTNATHPMPEVMQQLAQETGGGFFLAPSSSEVAGIYDKISQILSYQYLIEYVSSSTGGTPIYLDVKVDNNGNLGEVTGFYK
jgi:VWFA-related protein